MFSSLKIYAYSGTGNTLRAAKSISGTFQENGTVCDVRIIKKDSSREIFQPDPNGILGLMSPTMGGIQPPSFFKFIFSLPKGNGMKAFVAATCAWTKLGPLFIPGWCGFGVYLAALILLFKGYKVVGVTAFPYAHNWTSLLPPYWNRLEKKIADENDIKCSEFAGRLIRGERVFKRFIDIAVGIILLPLILGFLLIGHKFLAKTMFANHRCNGCGQCAKNCPKGAIKMLGGRKKTPYWTYKCEQCMRCAGFCPKKAVEGSYLLIIAHFTAYSLLGTIPFTIVGFLKLPGGISTIASYLFLLVFLLLIFFVIYSVFYLLYMIPVLRRFFSYLTPTYYWRKYREPDTKGLLPAAYTPSRSKAGI